MIRTKTDLSTYLDHEENEFHIETHIGDSHHCNTGNGHHGIRNSRQRNPA